MGVSKGIKKQDAKRAAFSIKSTNIAALSNPNNNLPQSVYKRKTEYPAKILPYSGPTDRFVTPTDECFEQVLKSSYQGLSILGQDSFSTKFHSEFQSALIGLESIGAYQFDVTQPAGLGSKLAKTYVTRCLVGEAGTTYKYLGLRMFSYPWNPNEIGSSEYTVKIGDLNKTLIDKTRNLLKDLKRESVGSCEYNLTLINRYST